MLFSLIAAINHILHSHHRKAYERDLVQRRLAQIGSRPNYFLMAEVARRNDALWSGQDH